MREIQLTKGFSALVDDDSYQDLAQFKWCALRGRLTWYAVRGVPIVGSRKRRLVMMHRVILGTPDGYWTDHVDGNGLNNQRSNLRVATNSQNAHNQTRKRAGASSLYRGVSWCNYTGRWRAVIQIDGKMIHLGRFESEVDAARAYNAAGAARDPWFFTPNVIPL